MRPDPYRYFRIEAREIVEGFTQGVLALEKGVAERDALARLLRLAHTLKGAARVVKQIEIAELAHGIEDVLAVHRDGGRAVPRADIAALLRSIDAISGYVAALESGPVSARIARAEPLAESFDTVRVEICEIEALTEGIAEAGVQISGLARHLAETERAARLADTLAEQLASRGSALNGSGAAAARVNSAVETLRGLLADAARGLGGAIARSEREIGHARDAADALRLMPASTLFGPLERAVRDVAESLDKQVVFEASGGDIRLDAHVLASMRDALLHVVRNAVAHGIEPASERSRSGKPTLGRVELRVERRGSRVAFTAIDDGAGIDVEAVRAVAVAKGLISASDAAALEPDAVVALVLRGGVSTTGQVTQLSGRGIGLDVLRDTAGRLKGELSIRTEARRGTRVDLCVPVSLASLPTLVVEVAGTSISLPLDSVRRTVRLVVGDIARSADSESIRFDGGAIPFAPLASLLRRETANARGRGTWSAVIVQSGSAIAAIGVDRVVGTTRVVVRPLPMPISADPVVAGASLDADGNPSLVLDPEGLVTAARGARRAQREAIVERRPVLVIDDSLTTRMLERSILESAGYEVDLAVSGEDALAKARLRSYGLFLVDVEMPGMDGFEFVAATQNDPALRMIPAIIVTSRDSADDRRRSVQAGARAHIAKGEFDQTLLVQTIRQLVG